MMEEIVKSLALFGGVVAMAVPAVTAAFNQARLLRSSGDHFVVKVDGKTFSFNIKSFADAEIVQIDAATRAVEEHAEAHV